MKRIAILLLCLFGQPAIAAMSLDKIIVYLDDTPDARDDIVVSNPDKQTLYLKTELFRVDNPGMPDEQRVRVVDPREFKLLVSPSKAVIPAGEQKRFRLMSLERGLDREKVYRVTFKPIVGDIKTDKTALKILVAYQALVFIQPQSGKYQLVVEKSEDNKLALANHGNVNVEVSDLQYCQAVETCSPLESSGRIYSGAKLLLDTELSDEGFLEFLARSAGKTERVRLPL